MIRPLRLEYAGALYYVTSRGDTGSVMAAATQGDGIYVSKDFGQTWDADPATSGAGYNWTGLSISSDGTKLVAISEGMPCSTCPRTLVRNSLVWRLTSF